MIPTSYLQEWSNKAPWTNLEQIEQDLIICRALCDLFNSPKLIDNIAFRGGTAINKLLFHKALRYSEDIDLVQINPVPIGTTIDAIRETLSWLGNCKRNHAEHSIHLIFKFTSEANQESELKLKIEINTREHKNKYGIKKYPFFVDSDWYKSQVDITSFEPEELLGTKLRALLQRRKNRDLFDLNEGLKQLSLDIDKIITCFNHYLLLEGKTITRAIAEERMLQKLQWSLTEDIAPLLPAEITFTEEDAIEAFGKVWFGLITCIPGESWKLSEQIIEKLRKERIPNLLR